MSDVLSAVKLDFSSFYKFVASVGLLLVAAAVAVPWFALRMATPETLSGSDAAIQIDAATDSRVHQYVLILAAYPWLSAALAVLGACLLTYGLVAWRRRQREQDRDEDEIYRQRRELGQTVVASEEDRVEKLNQEADDRESGDDGLRLPVTIGNAAEVPAGATRVDAEARYRERRALIEQTEKGAAELIAASFGDSHQVETGVRVGGSGAQILDLVARASDPMRWTSFALEVRLVDRTPSAASRLRDTMVAVAVAARGIPEGQVQIQRVGRPPIARSVSICLLIVADERRAGDNYRPYPASSFASSVSRTVDLTNGVLSRKVGVIVVSQREFSEVRPDWMRDSMLSVMQHPEAPVQRLGSEIEVATVPAVQD